MKINLMIPGPVDVSDEIRQHMSKPLVPHYGKEWCEFYATVREKLKKVLLTDSDVYLQVCSGHGGLEVALNGAARRGEKVLVINNGYFGQRFREISEALELEPVEYKCAWGKAAEIAEIEEMLKRHPDIKAVICAHSETSTGVANPIREIGGLLKNSEAVFIVDTVSSAGAMELRTDDWGIDFCVTAPQKGLEAPAGLAIITISKKAWSAIERKDARPAGYYCNPLIWRDFDRNNKAQPYFVTMPTSTVSALSASLDEIISETMPVRWERHRRIAETFRRGIINMGLELFSAAGPYSGTVTVFNLPQGISSLELLDFLYTHYQIRISAGLGAMPEKTARIGHMGPGAALTAIIPVLLGIEDFLRNEGLNIPVGISLQGISALE